MDMPTTLGITETIVSLLVAIILMFVKSYMSKNAYLKDIQISREQEQLIEELAQKAVKTASAKLGLEAKQKDIISLGSEILTEEIDASPNKLKAENFDTDAIIERIVKH